MTENKTQDKKETFSEMTAGIKIMYLAITRTKILNLPFPPAYFELCVVWYLANNLCVLCGCMKDETSSYPFHIDSVHRDIGVTC